MNLLFPSRLFLSTIITLVQVLIPGLARASDDRAAPDSISVEIHRLIHRADSLIEVRQPDSALVLGTLALAKARDRFGEEDTTTARALVVVGEGCLISGNLARSESLFARALTIRDAALPSDHLDVAESLNNLAVVYLEMGRYADSERLFTRALPIYERNLEPNALELAKHLSNQGSLYYLQGKYAEAEPFFERALSIKEEAANPDPVSIAIGRGNLAALYRQKGEYESATSLLEQSLASLENALGSEHWYLSTALFNLGALQVDQGEYGSAEPILLRALELLETGPESGQLYALTFLNQLSRLYANMGDYPQAESYNDRALSAARRLGDDHPKVAELLKSRADIYRDQGRYSDAEPLLTRALAIWKRSLGPEHPFVGDCLREIARNRGSLGGTSSNLKDYREFLRSRQAFINYVFSSASEEQKLRYLERYPLVDPSFLSFAFMAHTDPARRSALEMILRGKAIVIDALSTERGIVSYSQEIVTIAERLGTVCGEIATLYMAGSERLKPEIYHGRLAVLKSEKDSLEAVLSGMVWTDLPERLSPREIDVAHIAATLPPGGLLCEIVKYRPYDFSKTGTEIERTAPPRYIAFTLNPEQEVRLTDLGPAAEIDSLVSLARKRIYDARNVAYTERIVDAERRLSRVTTELSRRVFAPLMDDLDGVTHIIVSPDGQLNLLPFEILRCPDGSYLLEKYKVSYVSCGRDLLRHRRRQRETEWAAVFADPAFDAPEFARADGLIEGEAWGIISRGGVTVESTILQSGDSAPRPSGRGAGGTDVCRRDPFPLLPDTRKEAESITRTLEDIAGLQVSIYLGSAAREKSLKDMADSPRILHLSTHGYFCEDRDPAANASIENPLLRSGLALAGANCVAIQPDGEDGLLTALEVSALNLMGTELTTLSACETGVGEVKNGEGVFGLRRAFQSAGAESILMSLWAVPDEETTILMNRFYESWLEEGMTKQEALRRAELTLIGDLRERYGAAHPLLWGGFVLAGSPD